MRDLVVSGEALHFAAESDGVATLTVALGRAGVGIVHLSARAASLEQLFLELTEAEEPVEAPAA